MKARPDFKEEQGFTQWWLWSILIGLEVLFLYAVFKQVFMHEPFGENPMPDMVLIFFTLFILLLILVFFNIRLKTEIDHHEIRIAFAPLGRKTIALEDIKDLEIRSIRALGFGLRMGSEFGTIYRVKGRKGLGIKLKNGGKIFVGTQKEQEMRSAIKKYL